jgi:O-antigen biosynthesis protein
MLFCIFFKQQYVIVFAVMKVLYTRYNRHRLPEFQTETCIIEDNGIKKVTKKAVTPKAVGHIKSIADSFTAVKQNIISDEIRIPKSVSHTDKAIIFDYIEGDSFDYLLFNAFLNKDKDFFLQTLDKYVNLLNTGFQYTKTPIQNPHLKDIFGVSPESFSINSDCRYTRLSMVDLVFENLIIKDNHYYFIDNEWVFPGSLPVNFSITRSLFYFYKVKYIDFEVDSFVPFKTLLSRYNINPQDYELYRKMDESFQSYVFGKKRYYSYKNNYAKQIYSVELMKRTIDHQSSMINQMYEQLDHLNNVHKTLNQWIKDKDKELNYIKNTASWRITRSVCNVWDRLFRRSFGEKN